MSQIYFREVFEYPIKEFKSHLENDLNERIFFSGKYGIGKTKFLEDFFEAGNQTQIFGSDKYDVFRVFPVNYSISSNEDIIKYIKYDLIIELLKKTTNIDNIDLRFIDTLPLFLKKNLYKVAAGIILMTPKLGKEIADIFEKVNQLREEFVQFHETLNQGDGDKMIEYIEQMETQEGGIYENDIITRIISNTISGNSNKKSILIVDDIDRLDPEHVFRILNVFASHFDSNNGSGKKNKFNFEKIIVVCDLNNIRNIFYHRYGNNVDFIGYIDKFYSSDIYNFDNKRAIKGILSNVFNEIKFEVKGSERDEEKTLRQFYFKNGFLVSLLCLFLDRSHIGLRSLVKLNQKIINYHYEQIVFNVNYGEVSSWKIPLTMQIKLLRDFLGDYDHTMKVLDKCLQRDESIENMEYFFGHLLFIYSGRARQYYRDGAFVFNYEGEQIVIDATVSFGNDQINAINLFHFDGKNEKGEFIKVKMYEPTTKQFWQLLLKTCMQLNRCGYLN